MSRTIDQIVNQQILRWTEEQRALGRRSSSPSWSASRPVICISREFGALGGELGRLVAAELGYSFYAQELVHEIARHAHARQRIVESLDERVRTGIRQWVSDRIELGTFAASDYLRNLSEVVLTLGRHGKTVIVGRGAHLILDNSSTLRVRCVAPLEWRVEQIAKREHLDTERAREYVVRVDAERALFFKTNFQIDITDPSGFDLVLNTSRYSLPQAAELVVSALRLRFPALAAEHAPASQVQIRSSSPVARAVGG